MPTSTSNQEKIRKAYIEYVLEFEKNPTAFHLCKKAKIKEEDFYEDYNSVNALENDVWLSFFEETKHRIQSEEVYASYSIREKILAFYFTWIEVLKGNRSYAMYSVAKKKKNDFRPDFLKGFRQHFLLFADELMMEGRESGEIAERPLITEQYGKGLWLQVVLILDFWVKDTSKGFEQTDVFIEKAVNFAFDLIGRSALDSSFDFFKFLFQNR